MSARTASGLGLLAAALLAVAGGCAKLDLRPSVPFPLPWEEKPQVPEKLVAFWTDTILYQPNQPPIRGFGGRLMFYGPGGNKPVKVSGELVVYAFDEEGREPTDVKPDRKYVFPRDQFGQHYSESKLGHSYSVWIPVDAAGGPQRAISLIARFIPDEGPVLVGEQARQILPGPPLPASQAAAPDQQRPHEVPAPGGAQSGVQAVRAAAYESAAVRRQEPGESGAASRQEPYAPAQTAESHSPDNAQARMSTMTIPLPPRFSGSTPAPTDSRAVNATAAQHPARTVLPAQAPAGPPQAQMGSAAQLQPFPPGCQPDCAEPQAEPTGQWSPHPWTRPTLPRSTHYSPPRFPVRARPAVRPTAARELWQPSH